MSMGRRAMEEAAAAVVLAMVVWFAVAFMDVMDR